MDFGFQYSTHYTHHYIIRNCFTCSKLQFSTLSYVISSQVCILGSKLWQGKFLILKPQTISDFLKRCQPTPALVTLCISVWLFWISGALSKCLISNRVQIYYDKETKQGKECTSFTSKDPSFLVLPDKSSYLQAKMASWTWTHYNVIVWVPNITKRVLQKNHFQAPRPEKQCGLGQFSKEW